MELTVNQFSKGLQIDTHPMVLDNNTLSDALNATFVTMNGNEVILQNDMGNRRIDNAFLPSGYLPLGMKEYGGVIYVAAYNPLTNRGLIGSFPSPLRKINIDNDKGGFLDFNSFVTSYRDDEDRKYGYVELEYIIIPISDKIVLHTGDKFSIYSSQIAEFLLYLLPDYDDNRKNNLFTFQIGVFNSLNEFVDITNRLKEWDFIVSEKLRKYFINTESNVPNETIADNELLKARNRLAINTYSQKMSSPLYLKAIINHISNLSCSIIEAEFIDNTKAVLTIEVNYQYNCPDNINGEIFLMLFNDKETTIDSYDKEPIYLEEFNLYSRKIVYKTIINDFNNDPNSTKYKNKYNYELKFPLLHNFEEWNYPIYVESLNKKGTIDLSKIGSNIIIFKGYRYFNNTSTKIATLEVNLESYPKKGSKIYLEIKAKSHSNNNIVKDVGEIEKPGVGTFTITFPYETFGERELYYLEFTKKIKNGEVIVDSIKLDEERKHFFITTGIFNGNYIGKKFLSEDDKSLFYDNNGKLIYSYDYIKDIYIEDFSEIQKLDLTPILKYFISNDITDSILDVEGNYIFPVNHDVDTETYKINETWDIINTLDLHIEVNNPELYPKEIDNALDVGRENKKLRINNIIQRTINKKTITKNGSYYYYGDEDLYELSSTNYKLEDNEHIITISELIKDINTTTNLLKIELKSSISVNNILRGKLIEKNIFCEHVITSFWDFIRKHYYGTTLDRVLIKNPYFCIDYEGIDYASITYTDLLKEVQNLKKAGGANLVPLNGKKANDSYIEEIVRDHISDIINDKSKGNLLVLELSTDDYIMGYLPCVLDYNLYGRFNGEYINHGININNFCFNASEILPPGPGICGNFSSFRRIWLKINKLEYIPILITRNLDDLGNTIGDNSLINYMYDDHRLHNLLQHIPHYYEYESGGKTLPEKVFNITNYSRTKEFEVDSNIQVNILGEAILLNNTNSIFSLRYPLISENITFKEGIIHSSLDFEEDFDNINNYKISCVIMDGDYDNHLLYTKDCYGKYFDPLFIYYNDNECFSYDKSFRASYIPEKFYVEELGQYMPELKSSRKLYSGKNSENTLINEYVYPYEAARNLFKSEKGFYYYDTTNNNKEFDEYDITSKLYEGGDSDSNSSRFLPLRTKNIFDRTYILGYGLTSENISNNIERLKLD